MNLQSKSNKFKRRYNSTQVIVLDQFSSLQDQGSLKKNILTFQHQTGKFNLKKKYIQIRKNTKERFKNSFYNTRPPCKQINNLQSYKNKSLDMRKQHADKFSNKTAQQFTEQLSQSISKDKSLKKSMSKAHHQKIDLLKKIIHQYNQKNTFHKHYANLNQIFGLKIENININKMRVNQQIKYNKNPLRSPMNNRYIKKLTRSSYIFSLSRSFKKTYTQQNEQETFNNFKLCNKK